MSEDSEEIRSERFGDTEGEFREATEGIPDWVFTGEGVPEEVREIIAQEGEE